MILHDYREITKTDVDIAKERQKMLEKAMALFAGFQFEKHSMTQLEMYFRFLLRAGMSEPDLSYNFMVHCEDTVRARAFIETLMKAINIFQKNSLADCRIVTENELAQNAGEFFTELEDGAYRVFAICDLQGEDNSADDDRNGRSDVTRSKKALRKWFLKLCEKTPNVCKVITASETVLRERFREEDHLYFRIFRNHIFIKDFTTEEVLKLVLTGLSKRHIAYSDGFERELKEYIEVVYPKADLRAQMFVDDLLERILTKYYGDPRESDKLVQWHIPFYNKRNKTSEECMEMLRGLVGLKSVKEDLLEIPHLLRETEDGVTPALHMAFVGNPGTGKTTVAQMMADLLYSMGAIQKNKVVTVSAVGLIGRYVGETPRKTKAYCEKAYGGILFVDEAYLLASTSEGSVNEQFRQECIGVLIQEMEDNRDRLVVIFAGYPKEMDFFLHESNAGLGSRLYKIITFEDFTDDEMVQIFLNLCEKENYTVTREAREKVRLKLNALRYSRDFGNARTVRKVFLEAKRKQAAAADAQDRVIREEHIILESSQRDYTTLKKELDAMIGLESAKQEIERAIATCRFSKESEIDMPLSKNMLFLGNAGTGKSTVARLFSEMLFGIGVTKLPNCVNISAGDLFGERNPLAALKKYCRRASGGVLFIDEAYVFRTDPWLTSMLLKVMEEDRDGLTIIMAGYAEEMNAFLSGNQGLKSRFPITIYFEDYSEEQLADIFRSMCEKYKLSVAEDGMERFREIIAQEKKQENFGNARTVRNIFEHTYRKHAENFMADPAEEKRFVITAEDLETQSSREKESKRAPIGFLHD